MSISVGSLFDFHINSFPLSKKPQKPSHCTHSLILLFLDIYRNCCFPNHYQNFAFLFYYEHYPDRVLQYSSGLTISLFACCLSSKGISIILVSNTGLNIIDYRQFAALMLYQTLRFELHYSECLLFRDNT